MKNPTLLVDVDDEGQVSVYWHDPEMSGRQAPEISVVYGEDREIVQLNSNGLYGSAQKRHKALLADHDAMIQDQWTQQIF